MKKLITNSNMWFISAIICLITYVITDNGTIWIIFAGWMVIEGSMSKKKEHKSKKKDSN